MKNNHSIAVRALAGALAIGAQIAAAQAPGQGQDAPPGQTPEGEQQAAPAAPQVAPPIAAPRPANGPRGQGAPTATPRPGEVLLNFQQADLQAVVKAMAQDRKSVV